MIKRGNILLVSNYPSDTAYAWWLMEHFWLLLGQDFEAHGAHAFVIFPQITTISDSLKKSRITPAELTLPWRSAKQALSILLFIRKNKIENVYFTDQGFFSTQYSLLRLFGVRRIVVHDHTPGDRPPIRGIRGTLKALRNKIPLFAADYVFAVSDLMRQRNILNGRVPEKKCITVQNGIKPIIHDDQKRSQIRKEWGANEDSVIVVTSGRAHPYKRFDFVIETAKLAKKLAPGADLRFLLIGDGPAMETLQHQVRDYGLESTVTLLGFRQDVQSILLAADIAMHAALGEGFSLSIIEYMSAGLTVLVPNIPSVSQAIVDGDTGIIYDWRAPQNAALQIISLMQSPTERARLGANAMHHANINFTLDKCTASFNRAISEAFATPS